MTQVNGKPNGTKAAAKSSSSGHIHHDDGHFVLTGPGVDYRFHVDASGDLIHDYYGAPIGEYSPQLDTGGRGWGLAIAERRREFPDSGRGDFRLPAIHIRHGNGSTVTHFKYTGYEILSGKPSLDGLPATFGSAEQVSTLVVRLSDTVTSVEAELHYSIFPAHNAIVRSFKVTNHSAETIELQRAASMSVDFPGEDWDFLRLCGDWGREAQRERSKVNKGIQGFQNSTGHSSHYYNPFFALVAPKTDETTGDAYGFNFVYSGSFSVDVERFAYGRVRAMMGLNPLHLSYPIAQGESFQSPECVSVYSSSGLGSMSRSFHRLYRDNLCRSNFVYEPRPTLLNSWEAVFCDFDSKRLLELATSAADLGVKLFVLDDGWFGNGKNARTHTQAGLGDWVPNEERFPGGFSKFVDDVAALPTSSGAPLQFGLWVEPEMVNPASDLYENHPEWVLASGNHERTEKRNQLVLDLGRREVQDHILDCMVNLLASADIRYIKWDCNRGISEMPAPHYAHRYVLGLYRVLEVLTVRFPDVLFEGCASGGGRFDPGILHYWSQSWTSDNTDAVDRLSIQFGTTLAYPASSMGCHVSACPNEQVGRITPLEFRAHVAMMGGSFGFELAMEHMAEEERAAVPDLIKLSEKINPIIIKGDMYRLALPDESNTPAAFYLDQAGDVGVLFVYRVSTVLRTDVPNVKLQGLKAEADYRVDGVVYRGAALMGAGLKFKWANKDYQSRVCIVERVY